MASIVLWILGCFVHSVVSQSPEFLTSQSQVVAVKGESAVIPCRIRNIGVHKVLWSFERVLLTFDDRRITDDSRISVERPYASEWNLRIADVTADDAGTYLCQLNTNPMMSYDVKLLVLNEPPSPVAPREVVTLSGSDVEIACKLPNLNDIATWSYKANEDTPRRRITEDGKFTFRSGQGHDSHVHTLVISDVRAGDEGLYLCRARSGIEAKTFLRVVVPPPPPSLEAKAESPNRLMVRWRRPTAPNLQVAGYVLYVQNHDTGKEHVFEVPPKKDLGAESFRVGDLSTNTTYTIQLATKLQMGDDVTLGKRSPEVNITTPLFVPQAPGWVKVKRVSDKEAEVVWSPPSPSKTAGIIRGYDVLYVPLSGKKKPVMAQQKTMRVQKMEGNKWRARLTGLKPKTRYHVRVGGFTNRGNGRLSKTVPYLHKALPPELSLNGRVLSDNSVLLTISTMGSARMTNLKMFYTEAKQPAWKRLDFSPQWKFTVVGGLDPRTSYFFKVKAKMGGKMKQCVTHITTPPHDLQAPQNVQVSATASTSIDVAWDYIIANNMSSLPLGYIVILEETTDSNDGEKRSRQSVVFNRTSVEIKDLKPGTKYNIQVTAFNGFGEGPRTDGLLFHIAESDIKQDSVNDPFPPRFLHELPERLTIQSGEPVKITCEAEGYPVPEVQWYSDGEPLGVAAQGSNQLHLANIVTSTTLTCRATSQWGEIEASTFVTVDSGNEDGGAGDSMTLKLTPDNIQVTTLSLVWGMQGGDPNAVDRFEIVISDASNRVLLTQTLPGLTRSFNLRSLQPETEYRAVLRAFGAQSNQPLAEAEASAVTLRLDGSEPAVTAQPAPQEHSRPKYRGQINLNVMDVTPTSASVEWGFSGLDSRHVQLFELKVKSRSNYTMLTETLQPHLSIMQLSLQPDQMYYVQVRAFDRRGDVLAQSIMKVTTPPQSASPTTPPAPLNTERPVLKRASLTLSSHAVTGDSGRLDWSLSGAQLADIGQFHLKVKDGNDRTLLRQEMTPEARSLTLSNLTPRTTYFVDLEAVDEKGAILATTTTSFTTTSASAADYDPDPAKLRVFTEELDTSSVKIAWSTPADLLPQLSGVTVQLTDIANVTLLTQQMSALTRSLTVRNLQPGERYHAHVQLKGQRGNTVKWGRLDFETEPTRGMPGRPLMLGAQTVNNTAVRLQWRNAPSPAPAPGSEDITGYVVNFARVDAANKPVSGTYQAPLFGSDQFVVIPNLRGGQRYIFQVAARNQYSFGPFSAPVATDLPL